MELPACLNGWTWTNISIALLVIYIIYYIYAWYFTAFPSLPGPPAWPVVGNIFAQISKGFGVWDIENTKKYGKVFRVMGMEGEELIVSDPAIIRHILVKDFPAFTNRRQLHMRGIFKKGLFDARDADWRRLRHILTPYFTSGRLKKMVPLVDTCIDRLLKNLEPKARSKEKVEFKELISAFSMDVIASTAFGIDLDSQADSSNPFVTNAKKLFEVEITNMWLLMITLFIPPLAPLFDKLGLVAGPRGVFKFYELFIGKAIKERQAEKERRPDFLQMMLDAENHEYEQDVQKDLEGVEEIAESEKAKGLSSEEILAQCLLFFFAAYDTTSTTMAFFLYNMAENPEAQEKLHQEIERVMADYKEANYEAVSKMTYMDQCMNETLRIYPAVVRLDRTLSYDIDIEGLHIPANTVVTIPVYAIHHDDEVWPQPEKFDPERFSTEAKAARGNFHHMPFGLGPRQCIGIRLGLMEMKLAFVKLLRKYRFKPAGVPLGLGSLFLLKATNGVWVVPELR